MTGLQNEDIVGGPARVRCVAPSGCAALNINGQTIHSFGGLGHMNDPLSRYEENAKGETIKTRMQGTDVLILDEFSMISSEMLHRLDRVMRTARGCHLTRGDAYKKLPFGGVQVIMVGDPCQLPPVKPLERCIDCGRKRTDLKNGEWKCPVHGIVTSDTQWAWKAEAWDELKFKYVLLSQVYRQQDMTLRSIMHELWEGHALSSRVINQLTSNTSLASNAVKLFPNNDDVERLNDAQLKKLKTPASSYTCEDDFVWNPVHNNLRSLTNRSGHDGTLRYYEDHRYRANLTLKVGMPVLLLINLNINKGLVNGSQGRIIRFQHYDITQLPKAGGRFTDPEWDPEAIHDDEKGQYLRVYGPSYLSMRQDQIRTFMTNNCDVRGLPVVKFNNLDKPVIIFPDCSITEHGFEEPHSLLMRTQIPLLASWAITIHKSQGMTLEHLEVDVSRIWARGQFYTALSRAKTLEGLRVIGLRGSGANQTGREDEVDIFLEEYFSGAMEDEGRGCRASRLVRMR